MGFMNRKDFAKHKLGDKVKPKLHTGPGKTKQEFRQEADLNYQMARFAKTGMLPPAVMQGVYADVSEYGDYAEVLRRVTAAQESFNALPPDIRFRFQNRPENLVAFLQDANNREEAVKLGLIDKPVEAPKEPVLPAVPAVK